MAVQNYLNLHSTCAFWLIRCEESSLHVEAEKFDKNVVMFIAILRYCMVIGIQMQFEVLFSVIRHMGISELSLFNNKKDFAKNLLEIISIEFIYLICIITS